MHILFITQAFADTEKDKSSVTYLQNFILHLKEHYNLKMTIVAMQYPFEQKQYSWHGLSVYALGGYHLPPGKKLMRWIGLIRKLIRGNKINHFTHIHALWLRESALVAWLLNRFLKIPVTCTLMGTELNKRNPYNFLVNLDHIQFVTVSPFHEKQFRERFKKAEPVTIPWGIKYLTENIPQDKKIDLLFVGYLNETKNFNLFLEIIAEVLARIPNIRVGVIGDFFGLDDHKKKANALGIGDHVTFYGLIPNEQVLFKMREAKILLHTSEYESQGYAMLEALSSGMYVISRLVGIAEKSEQWRIATNKEDFVKQILNILETYRPPASFVPYTINHTCSQYLKLYAGHDD